MKPNATKPQAQSVSLKVKLLRQERSLSCEMASLRMAALYQGVSVTETELVQRMPVDTRQPRLEGGHVVWVDANRLFAGNICGWQFYDKGLRHYPNRARHQLWGYGIYAEGIAEVATRIGLSAEVFDEVEEAYRCLEQGKVPIVIVPCGARTVTRKWSWYTPTGQVVSAINGEHAIVVRGYDGRRVWVNDPLNQVSAYYRASFERAFALLNNGVIVGPPRKMFPIPRSYRAR